MFLGKHMCKKYLYICISLQSQKNWSLQHARFPFLKKVCMVIFELSEYADLMHTSNLFQKPLQFLPCWQCDNWLSSSKQHAWLMAVCRAITYYKKTLQNKCSVVWNSNIIKCREGFRWNNKGASNHWLHTCKHGFHTDLHLLRKV